MSGALLYLAIVVIWAGVLVPRWLRPPTAPPRPAEPDTGATRADIGVNQGEAGMNAAEPRVRAAEPRANAAEPRANAAEPRANQGETGVTGAEARLSAAEAGDPRRVEPVLTLSATQRQARILRARRRTLAILTLLTTGAAGLAVAHLAAVWIIIPPAIMLAGFLVLLREAARIDAERARRRARATKASPGAGAGQDEKAAGVIRDAGGARVQGGRRARPTPAPAAAGQDPEMPATLNLAAQIIDISGRIGDQLYDQYSDAADRAVGD